jgi:hypothetical protein
MKNQTSRVSEHARRASLVESSDNERYMIVIVFLKA